MNILLIDTRVSRYEELVDAIDPNLAIGITFDYHADTFETIKARIIEALQLHGASSTAAQDSVSVGLIQHNYNAPTFSMVASEHSASSSSCIVSQVETLDPNLETWTRFKDFIVWCKTECGAAHFDMMACALYSNPDWKYIIDTLAKPAPGQTGVTGVDIRASTDDTGSAALGGDWFLESHSGVNLKGVYFTEQIETYRGVFGGSAQHSFFITSAGAVYGTGGNGNGELGLGNTTSQISPTLIPSLTNVVAVSAGGSHSLFLTSTGNVYGAGRNDYGQLGLENAWDRWSTTLIQIIVVAISAGRNHSLFLTSGGEVYSAGWNVYGELGVGDNVNRNAPTLIPSFPNIVAVAAGDYHSLFLTSTGNVYGTGYNYSGQLGLDNQTNQYSPALIPSLTNVVAISVGGNHSLFLTSAGAVYSAGWNGYGQLGLGANVDNRYVPTLITALANVIVIAISAGSYHSLFLTSTGAVYSTGYNDSGQLGLGDNVNRFVPTLITTLTNVIAISAAAYHSLFLSSAGKVYATGQNSTGRLGLGDTTNRNVPTLVSGTYVCVPDMIAPANFVSVGEGTNSIAYSYDGVNWNTSIQNTSVFSDQGYSVSYNSALSRWVAVGAGTNNTIAYSLNGITWVGVGKTIFSTRGNGVA